MTVEKLSWVLFGKSYKMTSEGEKIMLREELEHERVSLGGKDSSVEFLGYGNGLKEGGE
jgi:hypothetical protein